MVASSKRSFRVFILLAVLVFVGSFFLAAQPETAGSSLEALISGTTSDSAAVLSSLKDEDLPLALSAAEVLKFKSLHGDGRITVQDAEGFRSAVEQKIKTAQTVSLVKTEACTVPVPQRKAVIGGQELLIPAHFRAPEPLQIVETKPNGEAGTIFPEIRIVYVSDSMPVSARLLIDEKPVEVFAGKGKTFVYQPQLAVNTMLSIGTHTASVTLSDAKGRQASTSWAFTVGVKPAPIPALPADAKVVATLSVPIGTLFPGTSSNEVVTVTVRQGSDGQRFFEYSITRKGVSYSTSSLYLLASTLKAGSRARGITFTPLVETMFPNVPMTFSYAYDGPGTVLSHTWTFTGFASSSDPQGTTASVVTSDKISYVGCRLMVRTPLSENDPPYIDQEIYAAKGIYPITVAPNPDTTRTWVAFKTAKTPASISCKRAVQSHSSTVPEFGGYFVEGETLPWGDVGKLTVNRARWRPVGTNEAVSIENATATQARVLFGEPGVAELVHDISMTLTWGDERYDWTYQPATSSLVAALDFRANTTFKRFPPGIIANTERKIIAEKFEVVINGEKRVFASQADLTISPPWVLARPQVYPNSPPITLSKLYPVFVTTQPKVALTALKNFEASLKYDGATYPNSAIPLRMYFYNLWTSKADTIDPDTIELLLPCSEWLSIKTYPSPAPLLRIETEPSPIPAIYEGQPLKLTGKIVPQDGNGVGEYSMEKNTLDLLDGYKATSLEQFLWEAKLVATKKSGANWVFDFKPEKGTGTYSLSANAIVNVSDSVTGSKAKAIAQTSDFIKVQDGLRITSPVNGFAYPLGKAIVVSVASSAVDWKDIEWTLNEKPWIPEQINGSATLFIEEAKEYTLVAKVKIADANNNPVMLTDQVRFSAKPVTISLSPTRKVLSPPPQEIPLALSIRLGDNELKDLVNTVEWVPGKMKGQIHRVDWSYSSTNDTETTLNILNPPLSALAKQEKQGATTFFATVTIRIWSTNPQIVYDNTFTIGTRADIWTTPTPILSQVEGIFPKKAISGTKRTFEPKRCRFTLYDFAYLWTTNNQSPFKVVLLPAVPGVRPAEGTNLLFSWRGPEGQESSNSVFSPVFNANGEEAVDLKLSLDFQDAGQIQFVSNENKVFVYDFNKVLFGTINPQSFSIPLGKIENLFFITKPLIDPQPDSDNPELLLLDNGYKAVVNQVQWKTKEVPAKEGVFIGNPFPYQGDEPGSVTGAATAKIRLEEVGYPKNVSEFSLDVPFNGYVNSLSIRVNANGIPLDQQAFHLGQKITISYEILCGQESLPATSQTWHINGFLPVKYAFTQQSCIESKLSFVSEKDKTEKTVTFCLYDPDENVSEKVGFLKVVVGDIGKEINHAFKIPFKRPYAIEDPSSPSPLPEVQIFFDSELGDLRLGFPNTPQPAANAFGTIHNPTDVKYRISSYQLALVDARRKYLGTASSDPIEEFKKTISADEPYETSPQYWLDRLPPAEVSGLTWFVEPGQSHFALFAHDSPSFSLDMSPKQPHSFSSFSDFRTFFVVKPANLNDGDGIWCPITVKKWSWHGKADFNSVTNKWENLASKNENLNSITIDKLPQWFNKAYPGYEGVKQNPDWRKK